jgi:hypothetical protein
MLTKILQGAIVTNEEQKGVHESLPEFVLNPRKSVLCRPTPKVVQLLEHH